MNKLVLYGSIAVAPADGRQPVFDFPLLHNMVTDINPIAATNRFLICDTFNDINNVSFIIISPLPAWARANFA